MSDYSYDSVKELFERYYLTLVEYVWRIVGCEEIARDVVQDVFVKIMERQQLLPQEERLLRSYLYSMVRNHGLNYLRDRSTARRHQTSKGSLVTAEENALDALIYAESIHRVHTAIQSLPEGCRNVCQLTYLEGKSNQETADHHQISINTVKTQKRRAIDLLRKQLLPALRSATVFFCVFF